MAAVKDVEDWLRWSGAGMRWTWVGSWMLGSLVLICGVSVVLLNIDLLWRVPAPLLVLASLLAAAAAPGFVPAFDAWRRWWWAPIAGCVAAGLAGCAVVSLIAPSRQVLAGVLAEVPVPAGAGPIETTGCRYCTRWLGSPPAPQASRLIEANDVEAGCRQVTDQFVRNGWQLDGSAQSGCDVNLTRRAPFGTTYRAVITSTPAGDYIRADGGGTTYQDSHVLVIVAADKTHI